MYNLISHPITQSISSLIINEKTLDPIKKSGLETAWHTHNL